ncbi:potassium/proton antiporter [Salinimonas sp. HHU 13199]|uniref:Potassium/proton antiporter n=1 Tax=Salinimonas profundi TaxID=2729140 RepID=A0ABR8LJV0_9ALTE|nr:potassium/proton antiporter [Salinimonas profundi]MBD3585553.1 potassium/proton antiporter [Salinimonas profundi]
MFAVDFEILIAALLLFAGILSSKLSPRLGLPMLVIFLLVGMLAGEAGIGGIQFDDAQTAHALGTLALAVILFDGGLQTSLSAIKLAWKPASLLSTVGVAVTAGITGIAASYILGIPPLVGLLLGAIVGSTDAAAVFSILRSAGIHIKPRLKSTLEIESASNDPMAIFLVVGLLQLITNQMKLGADLALLFAKQMGIGAVTGLFIGWVAIKMINRIQLIAAGLYPVLVAVCGALAFGISASLGGSGFLSTFIAGVIIGNSRFVFQQATFLFMDGLAWLSQIAMFVMLGLLVNPPLLLEVWAEGLVIAIILVFVARPLAVAPLLALTGFNRREISLVSWVGLRGSVPIILAIFPLLFGIEEAGLVFNVVFFVVLLSATVQGSTLPWAAKKLKLTQAPPASPVKKLEVPSLGGVNADIVEIVLSERSRVCDFTLAALPLPIGVNIAMIVRNSEVLPPEKNTVMQAGDHLFITLEPQLRSYLDALFAAKDEMVKDRIQGSACFKGETSLSALARFFDAPFSTDKAETAADYLTRKLKVIASGALVEQAGTSLSVSAHEGSTVTVVRYAPD